MTSNWSEEKMKAEFRRLYEAKKRFLILFQGSDILLVQPKIFRYYFHEKHVTQIHYSDIDSDINIGYSTIAELIELGRSSRDEPKSGNNEIYPGKTL